MIFTDRPQRCLSCGALPDYSGHTSILFICGATFRLMFREIIGWEQTSKCKKVVDRAFHPQMGWTCWKSCEKCARPFPNWKDTPEKFCQACAIQNALDAVAEELEYSRKDWDPVRAAEFVRNHQEPKNAHP